MPSYSDQTGQTIFLESIPQRIISLVPSQTELLYDLGLDNEVAGITKFCVHPGKWFRSKQRVGGTKRLNMKIIQQLQPDLIIANKEENVKEQVEELQKKFPVWISDIHNLDDAFEMIEQVGMMTGKDDTSGQLISAIKKEFSQLQPMHQPLPAIYLIWQNPYITVGGDTFIHSMMEAAGFSNLFENEKRYPEITIEQLQRLNPALLLLSSEPFPFKQKHAEELQALLPGSTILLVDGEMFSWYGSRLRYAPACFARLHGKIRGNTNRE